MVPDSQGLGLRLNTSFPRSPLQLCLTHTHTYIHTYIDRQIQIYIYLYIYIYIYRHIYVERETKSQLSIPQDSWGIGSVHGIFQAKEYWSGVQENQGYKNLHMLKLLIEKSIYSHITYTSFHTLQIISVLQHRYNISAI